MSDQINKAFPKGYMIMWIAITAVYAVWMTFFMKYDTYPQKETGMTNPVYYTIWVALSCVFLLLFTVYIKVILFGREPGRAVRLFCLVNLIFGCAFITWYGFLKDPTAYTASMIGLDYPWHFKMWGVFASLSVFSNVLYMYRKNGYYSRAGVICGSIGSAAIFVTINVPSAGEELILNSLRCMSHWTGALVFAVLSAAPIIIFLIGKAKTADKRYIALLIVFAIILASMLVFLVTIGKNGVIESLPMWAAYLLLFLVNFSGLFNERKQPSQEKEKVTV